MTNNKQWWLLSTVVILITLWLIGQIVSFFRSTSKNESLPFSRETLIVWGEDELSQENCLLWIISVVPEPVTKTVREESSCHYEAISIEKQPHLISLISGRAPTQVLIHEVDDNYDLTVQKVIDLNGTGITSLPQWGLDGMIYFSGVMNSREQIFRFDTMENTFVPYLDTEEGFVTNPIISPSGKYLAYEVWVTDVYNNRFECQLNCSTKFYRILNIEQEVVFDPFPLIKPFLAVSSNDLHCDATWSPTGQYLVIKVNCLSNSAATMIVDVENNQIETALNNDDESFIRSIAWVSDNEFLVYRGSAWLDKPTETGYWIYSTQTHTLQKDTHLPEYSTEGMYTIDFFDWSPDKMLAVGTTMVEADFNQEIVSALVIADMRNSDSETIYIPTEVGKGKRISGGVGTQPQWSPSGAFIAYYSYEPGEGISVTGTINVVNREGELVFTTTVQAVSPQFTWVAE